MNTNKFLSLLLISLAASMTACSKNQDSMTEAQKSEIRKKSISEAMGDVDTNAAKSTVDTKEDTARIFFAYDSSEVSDSGYKALKTYVKELKAEGKIGAKMIINGHCDERGTQEYNMALGMKRANAIKAILVKLGVPTSHIKTHSYGKSKPLVFGDNEEAWKQNRRAEIEVN